MFPKGAPGTQNPYVCWEGVPRETSEGKRHAHGPKAGALDKKRRVSARQ